MTIRPKDLRVRPISRRDANTLVKRVHYSGKVSVGAQVHLGVFYGERCGGALQFGAGLFKRQSLRLVEGTRHDVLPYSELDRMDARMVRGTRVRPSREAPGDQSGEEGSTPIHALQPGANVMPSHAEE